MIDSLSACMMDLAALDSVHWLADFRVLSVSLDGQLAHARVAMTSVATQREAGGHWDISLGIREDTVEWLLTNGRTFDVDAPDDHRWRVCGEPGFTTKMLGRERDLYWHPAGASRAVALRLVDSIRAARHLPILR